MAYQEIPKTYAQNSDLMDKLISERKAAREFQERKHKDWNDNYELYRNKVRTNRLTQRQAVNIPLMKETEKTILSKIDDPPNVEWKELSGDQQKELYYQEIWNDQFKKKKFEWKDVLDKKNVLRYGFSVKKLNIGETGIDVDVLDPFDVVFDPLMNPLDVETARFWVQQNIFRSVREILADDRYDKKGKDALKIWLTSREGIMASSKNKEEWEKKLERLKAMGLEESEFSLFAGGDVLVNLCEHFTQLWDPKTKKFERRVIVYAEDGIELMNEALYDLIGVDTWPVVVWSEDPETNDIYPDSVADLVRTPNKILNVWFSQMIESRTLRNFQMHWYDATIQGYAPQTYEPGPGKMLPAPGEPGKTIMPVEISGLDETLTAIDFLIRIVERGSGATAIEKGVSEKKQITLGEVEMLVGKAMERVVGIAKFYRASWYELCIKWDALMHANSFKMTQLFKKGRTGRMYPKKIYSGDWKSDIGYEPIVSSTSEQEEEKTKGIQRMMFVKGQFPMNKALNKILMKRELEILDLTAEETDEILKEQKENENVVQQPMDQAPPEDAQLAQAIQGSLSELQNIR